MRIVHVVQSLGLGGQERLVLHLSRELRRRGHEVTVISLTPGGALKADFEKKGDRSVRVSELGRKLSRQGHPRGSVSRTSPRERAHSHTASPA